MLIVPVLVNHVDYGASPFGPMQMMPVQNGTATPLIEWSNPDDPLAKIAVFLREAIEERCRGRSAEASIEEENQPPEPEGHRTGHGYCSDDRNVFPECVELLLSATQGTDAERICLNGELRCGAERLRHGKRTFLLQVGRLRLRIDPEGCRFSTGPGLGDEPTTDGPAGRSRIRRRTQRVWEITPPTGSAHLDGYILGEENISDLHLDGPTKGRVVARASTYIEDLIIEVLKDGKTGLKPQPISSLRGKLLKIVFAKALRRELDEIFLSESVLEPEP